MKCPDTWNSHLASRRRQGKRSDTNVLAIVSGDWLARAPHASRPRLDPRNRRRRPVSSPAGRRRELAAMVRESRDIIELSGKSRT